MSVRSLAYRLVAPVMMAGLLVISLLSGCGHSRLDPRLAAADAMMEEHPDSALMMLQENDTQKMVRNEEKALYGLLYTQARDKNVEIEGSQVNAGGKLTVKGEKVVMTGGFSVAKGATLAINNN